MDSIIVEDSGPLNGKIITIQDEDTKQLKKLRGPLMFFPS